MRLDKVLYLCTVILNILIMVQGKKQLSSKPKFAEVVIGDNEAKEMRESDVDKKSGYLRYNGDILNFIIHQRIQVFQIIAYQ